MKRDLQISTVDELGAIKAQIAELEAREKELAALVKQDMHEQNVQKLDGALFAAALSVTEKITVSSEAVKQRFPADLYPEFYKSNLVETLRVSARS
jgi:predicted phage-related endonuclease